MLAYLPIPVLLWWILRRAGWRRETTTTEMPAPLPTKIPPTTILPEIPTLPPDEEIPEMLSEIISEGKDEIVVDDELGGVPVEQIMQMYEEETGKKADARNLMNHGLHYTTSSAPSRNLMTHGASRNNNRLTSSAPSHTTPTPRNFMTHGDDDNITQPPSEYETEYNINLNQNVPFPNKSNFSLTQILNLFRQKNRR